MAKARRSNLWGGIATALIVCFCGMTAQGKYGGGGGTAENPYQIWSAYDMQAIGADYREWDRPVILRDDIDLGEFDGKDGREQFNVIGRRTADDRLRPFEGVFDGNGHTIVNFTYNSNNVDETGLFGTVSRGEIRNLGLIDPNVAGGTGEEVGSLVGWALSGAITGCYSDGGSIKGGQYVGGLVGRSGSCTITDCYSTGTVEGTGSSVGGLVGSSGDGPIINCYATGKVTGRDSVGGLVGFASIVVNSYWDADSGSPNNGIGTPKPRNEMMMADTFLNWGSCGTVWTINEGMDYPRLLWEGKPGEPIVGTPFPLLGDGSYSSPYLIYTPEELNAIGQIHCVWDKHFKMMADIDLSGYTGTQFNIIPSFTGVFDGNGHSISNFTYECNRRHFVGLFRCFDSGEIRNLGLIDPNVAAGTGQEVGSLVGKAYWGAITACYSDGGKISGYHYLGGLVGQNLGCTITECYSTGTVEGTGSNVGGLVGNGGNGTIVGCFATGSVRGKDCVGGLLGIGYHGHIPSCYASGNVIGEYAVGGLVGVIDNVWCEGAITQCYATGNVTGVDYVGGLIGVCTVGHSCPTANITECYATGTVSGGVDVGGLVGRSVGYHISNSYWGIETSNEPNMCGSQEYEATGCDPNCGKTTAEMKRRSTFTDWDFIDVWDIGENQTYPYLRTVPAGDINKDRIVNFLDLCIIAKQWMREE